VNIKNNRTKDLILFILVLIVVISSGFGYYNIFKFSKDVKSLKEKNSELTTNVMNDEIKTQKIYYELQDTKKLIPNRASGYYNVVATELSLRLQPGIEEESIGVAEYGAKLKVIDTSNPLWYKVELAFDGFNSSKNNSETILTSAQTDKFKIKNSYINGDKLVSGNNCYVCSKYLTESVVLPSVSDVPKGDKPFTYGILFYDDATKTLLEKAIWSKTKDKLTSLGYTGVNVIPVNRNTYEDDVKNQKFDAVESASGQFASANKDKKNIEVFAKDIINNTTSYTGIIITNKNSRITTPDELKGKKVLAYKPDSESGYKMQKSFLEDEGINVEKDLKLQTGVYHQVSFYKVAKGEADAGFVGDFIMSDSASRIKSDLMKSNIDVSTQEVEELRQNINVIELTGMKKIPNNPHSIKANLYKDKSFVGQLFNTIKEVYSTNKEGYDITEANSQEYMYLSGDE